MTADRRRRAALLRSRSPWRARTSFAVVLLLAALASGAPAWAAESHTGADVEGSVDTDQPTSDTEAPADGPAEPSDDEEAPPEEETDEPGFEPADVPPYIWVGAGVLVLLAVVWGVRVSARDESSDDEPSSDPAG